MLRGIQKKSQKKSDYPKQSGYNNHFSLYLTANSDYNRIEFVKKYILQIKDDI